MDATTDERLAAVFIEWWLAEEVELSEAPADHLSAMEDFVSLMNLLRREGYTIVRLSPADTAATATLHASPRILRGTP